MADRQSVREPITLDKEHRLERQLRTPTVRVPGLGITPHRSTRDATDILSTPLMAAILSNDCGNER